jgi:predicted S18 family serine protease
MSKLNCERKEGYGLGSLTGWSENSEIKWLTISENCGGGQMIKVPVLAVNKGKGVIVEIEIEFKKQGKGTLFLDANLNTDTNAKRAMKTAYALLNQKKGDMLVRMSGEKASCLCGSSLALTIFLGMYACSKGMEFKPRTFASGGIGKKGEIIPVGGLAEKVKAILGKADLLLVPKEQGLPIEGMKVEEVSDLKEAISIALVKSGVRNGSRKASRSETSRM